MKLSNGITIGTQEAIRTQVSFATVKQYGSSLSSQMPITFSFILKLAYKVKCGSKVFFHEYIADMRTIKLKAEKWITAKESIFVSQT